MAFEGIGWEECVSGADVPPDSRSARLLASAANADHTKRFSITFCTHYDSSLIHSQRPCCRAWKYSTVLSRQSSNRLLEYYSSTSSRIFLSRRDLLRSYCRYAT